MESIVQVAAIDMLQIELLHQITMMAQTNIKLEGKEAFKMLKLMEALEDHDDVQNVYANFDIDEQTMEQQNN